METPVDNGGREHRQQYVWETDHVPSTSSSIDWDAVFDALAASIRRRVLEYLRFRERPVSLVELATFVARRQAAAEATTITAGALDRIRSRLYHIHVPKLADGDLIRYDRESDRVHLTAVGGRVLGLLSV